MGGLADTVRGAGGEPGTAANGNGIPESADAAMFPTLTDEEIACLAEQGKRERFGPGDAVFVEGEPARNLFVVLEGRSASPSAWAAATSSSPCTTRASSPASCRC